MKAGLPGAAEALAAEVDKKLPSLIRPKFYADFKRLIERERYSDVHQEVMARLVKSVFQAEAKTFEDFKIRIRLAIRRSLFDLIRRHFGPHGDGRNLRLGSPDLDDAAMTDGHVRRDASLDIAELLTRFPEQDVELIIACDFMDTTMTDIAAMTGQDRKTVSRRLRAIHEKIRDALE